jgi:hypothetical protein
LLSTLGTLRRVESADVLGNEILRECGASVGTALGIGAAAAPAPSARRKNDAGDLDERPTERAGEEGRNTPIGGGSGIPSSSLSS